MDTENLTEMSLSSSFITKKEETARVLFVEKAHKNLKNEQQVVVLKSTPKTTAAKIM